MAVFEQRFEENVNGKFFVDFSCIACDTCTGIAPDLFTLTKDHDHAYVKQQPRFDAEYEQANEAMYACPVDAIGTL